MLSSSLLPVPHGFFTRVGGVSEGVFASMNVGLGSSDNPEAVASNRRHCAKALGFEEQDLVSPYQIHSAESVIVNEPIRAEADSYVTNQKGLLLGIVTADCLPVLMYEPSGIICAAHAGWKGAVSGVLEASIENIKSLGGVVENIHAVVGPAIAGSSYQVQQDFYDAVLSADSEALAFFQSSEQGYLFDLPNYARQRLQKLGVGKIEVLKEDTLSQPDKFFSYRRACLQNEKDYGRQLSAIGLKK